MEDRTFGDYRLLKPLKVWPGRTTWLAEQGSVSREVLVDELVDLSLRDAFLADIRAKASIDHPLIGSVYEAISEDGHCLAAMEKLTGKTIAERMAAREPLLPVEIARALRLLAEAMLHLDGKGIASEPLTPDSVHLDDHGVVRIANLARAGAPDPEAAANDITRLGEDLAPLVASGHPGANRVLTLLSWMRGEEIERPLTWNEVHSYGEQIEGQLVEVSHGAPTPTTRRPRPKKSPVPLIIGTTLALLLIGGVAAVMMKKGNSSGEPVAAPTLPGPVTIAAGEFPTPDGATISLQAFRVSATEVTIGQYAEFLETLDLLEQESRAVYDAKDQPEEKSGHQPDDWDAMLAAAREGGQWEGRQINLFCPVVNVDWWDAVAYCDWKKGRLPTQDEWFAALREKLDQPEILQPAPWGAVNEIGIGDRTPNGLHGMAGSVAEWTRLPVVNPANPLGRKRYVIVGASFLKRDDGALAREWTDDRHQRRPDLGFRIVLPAD